MITRVPRELGRPCRSHRLCRLELPAYQLQDDPRPRVRDRRGQNPDAAMVSPNEGNEVRRNGRQGVEASHSTVEPGEPSRGTLGREGDVVL
jgi:hypothetical protein